MADGPEHVISRRSFLGAALASTALATVTLALDPIPAPQEFAIVTEVYRDGRVYYMTDDRIQKAEKAIRRGYYPVDRRPRIDDGYPPDERFA